MSEHNDPYLAALALLAVAAGALALALLTNRGDLTSATLVFTGMGCAVTAIFLLTLYKGEPLEPELTSLLATQGTINTATLCADLGIRGNARFMPVQNGAQPEVIQYIPVSEGILPPGYEYDSSFILDGKNAGIVITPASLPLIRWLYEKRRLRLPGEEVNLPELMRSTVIGVLELADRIEVEENGDTVALTLSGYRLTQGCLQVRAASPKCCTMVGCPVCSLLATMTAQALNRTCTMVRSDVDPRKRSVRLILSLEPKGDSDRIEQEDEGALPEEPGRTVDMQRHQPPASSPDQWG
ncbi:MULTISPECIES: hypothetical protein [Methanoculleus]|uniref:DUF7982 domain-containing protein n=2 Tax=Methanoculleus TaxID=45989 RepID=A3CTB3_METMJ|nr:MULTISPECIES: hypothetical protein [Methanoculleus]ABN56613.1 hypothetical protein Memar_0680 [Methanoculleus marisnigri JR1]MCC7555664.1 hypothetical protein [Methanoculleus marisnigri]UYU18052.1 hypothetical protein OH143_10130 [Methanoculleus submarinus]